MKTKRVPLFIFVMIVPLFLSAQIRHVVHPSHQSTYGSNAKQACKDDCGDETAFKEPSVMERGRNTRNGKDKDGKDIEKCPDDCNFMVTCQKAKNIAGKEDEVPDDNMYCVCSCPDFSVAMDAQKRVNQYEIAFQNAVKLRAEAMTALPNVLVVFENLKREKQMSCKSLMREMKGKAEAAITAYQDCLDVVQLYQASINATRNQLKQLQQEENSFRQINRIRELQKNRSLERY